MLSGLSVQDTSGRTGTQRCHLHEEASSSSADSVSERAHAHKGVDSSQGKVGDLTQHGLGESVDSAADEHLAAAWPF
jgi:hypothetical protein